MAIFKKIKWVLGILLIFGVIISTNLIDRKNFIHVRDSIITIYEDRLIANDLIFEVLQLIQQKEVAVLMADTTYFEQQNIAVNTGIEKAINRFETTKLTEEESRILGRLKDNFENIKSLEKAAFSSNIKANNDLLIRITSIKENLNDLSKIQLEEGRKAMAISKRALVEVELFTHIEIYLLVFLAIVIQLLVIYQPKANSEK